MEYPMQQAPNLAGAIQGGFQMGQEAQMNNLKMLAAQKEIEQKDRLNSLYKLASTGNPQAVQQLSMVAPQAYEGLQKYQAYRVQRGAQLANSVLSVPEPLRAQRYQEMISEVEKEFGEKPQVPGEWSRGENGAEGYLKGIVAQARQVEDVAKERVEAPKREAELQNLRARTVSEYLQQKQTAANTYKTNLESQNLAAEQKAMKESGYSSPTAFKKAQEIMAENKAKTQITLPKIESQANNAIKLIDDIVSHEGMKSVVGAKNLMSGAITQVLPNWAGGKTPIRGTKAADFQAKFDQLQGQNFLQAFEALKGGGVITEIEGQKATQAISDMSTAQSEKQFKASAKELKKIIQSGVERAKRQGGLSSQGTQAPTSIIQEGQTATNPQTGQKLTFIGGRWQ